eukprot:c50989_g1_i1 orf=95-547(+)
MRLVEKDGRFRRLGSLTDDRMVSRKLRPLFMWDREDAVRSKWKPAMLRDARGHKRKNKRSWGWQPSIQSRASCGCNAAVVKASQLVQFWLYIRQELSHKEMVRRSGKGTVDLRVRSPTGNGKDLGTFIIKTPVPQALMPPWNSDTLGQGG